MELELFSWKDWDQVDTAYLQFSGCELKVSVGPHKPGTVFCSISVDYERGILNLYPADGDAPERYRLHLRVGDPVYNTE